MARKKTAAAADTRVRKTTTTVKKAEVRTIDADGIEEVKGGLTFEDGIVLTTTIVLLACVVLVFIANGRYPS